MVANSNGGGNVFQRPVLPPHVAGPPPGQAPRLTLPEIFLGDADNDLRSELGKGTYLKIFGPDLLAFRRVPIRVTIREDRVIGWLASRLPSGRTEPGPELPFEGITWIHTDPFRFTPGGGFQAPGVAGTDVHGKIAILYLTQANADHLNAAYGAWKGRTSVDPFAPVLDLANPAIAEMEENHRFSPIYMTKGRVSRLAPFAPERIQFDENGVTGWFVPTGQSSGPPTSFTLLLSAWTDVRRHLKIPGPFAVLTTLPNARASVLAEGLRVAKAGWPPRGFVLTGKNGDIATSRRLQRQGALEPFALSKGEGVPK